VANRLINLTDKERGELIAALPASSKLRKKIERTGNRIKIQSAKAKGRSLQYWVCERISQMIDIPYKQSDDQCLIHSREMGQAGSDIILRGEAKHRFPFSVECKASEQLDLPGTIKQVKANTDDDEKWIIVHKRKSIPDPIVIMAWDSFQELMEDIFAAFVEEDERWKSN
jgi:hypothetical protein